MAGTLDELFTEVNGVQLPQEVASEWGLLPQIETPSVQEPAPFDANPYLESAPPEPEPAMPTPADLQAQLPTAPGTSGSLRVSQSRPQGRPDLVQQPPEGADPMALMGPHAEAASIRTQGILRQAEGDAGLIESRADQGEAEAQFQKEMATDLAVKNAFLTQHNKDREARVAAKVNAVKSVDPGRVWSQASTFKKAVGLGAAFLGGFMEPVTGKNTALATIMQIIDQDIRAQETDIATQREAVYREERAIERETANETSDIERYKENQLKRLESLKSQFLKEQAGFQSQITRGKYQELIGVVADKAAETWDSLNQIWSAYGLNRYNAFYNARQGEMQARASMTSAAASMKNANTNAATETRLASEKDVKEVYLRDPATGKKLGFDAGVANAKDLLNNLSDKDKGLPGYANLTKDLKELIKLQNKLKHSYGGYGVDAFERLVKDPDYKRAQQLYEQVSAPERHNLYGAALTDNEAKKWIRQMPEPSTWLKHDSTPFYQNMLKHKSEQAQSNFAHPLGLRHEDGRPVDFVKDWGTLELPSEESRGTARVVEKVFGVRRALDTNPGLVGSDTVNETVTEIEGRAAEIRRGQDSDNDTVNQELINQAWAASEVLESQGRTAEAGLLRGAITDFNSALQSDKPAPRAPANKTVDRVMGLDKKQKHTVEPREKKPPKTNEPTFVPRLQKYDP